MKKNANTPAPANTDTAMRARVRHNSLPGVAPLVSTKKTIAASEIANRQKPLQRYRRRMCPLTEIWCQYTRSQMVHQTSGAEEPRDYAGMRRRLLAWYRKNKRDLPWRRTQDPYQIWISEIMLQQTRVAAVVPYYARFLALFPDAAALAGAREQDLLAAWAGLGYYSRARNLQKAARKIVELGEFPREYQTLRTLPGIGDY